MRSVVMLAAVAALAACAPTTQNTPVSTQSTSAPVANVAPPPGYVLAVDATDDGGHYLHAPSAERKGDTVTAWLLYDKYRPSNGTGSIVVLTEYDCANQRARNLSVTTSYSGRMTSGDPSADADYTKDWRPTAPNTIAELTRQFACDGLL